MKVIQIVASVLLIHRLTGCATAASPEALKINDADENMVSDCTFLGDLRGSSSIGGTAGGETGIHNAKVEVLEQAV